jgi:iron transport multicopper oxidase
MTDRYRHEFQIVHKSFDVTSNDTDVNPPFEEGQANPVRRDTVTIPPGGSVTLRWVADNPGAVSTIHLTHQLKLTF